MYGNSPVIAPSLGNPEKDQMLRQIPPRQSWLVDILKDKAFPGPKPSLSYENFSAPVTWLAFTPIREVFWKQLSSQPQTIISSVWEKYLTHGWILHLS
jgi:hypothetical protein